MNKCNKAGIKIHEYPSSSHSSNFKRPISKMAVGVKVASSPIDNKTASSVAAVELQTMSYKRDNNNDGNNNNILTKTKMNNLDLDITNYDMKDLFNLFDIKEEILTEEILKNAKKRMHKLHPDKCQNKVDPQIYDFFKIAYQQLEFVYDTQTKFNKLANSKSEPIKQDFSNIYEDYNDKEKKALLDKYVKSTGGFNNANFNEQFEKYYVKSEYETMGYKDWLKSDDGIIKQPEKISQGAINSYIEEQKKQLKSIIPYKGVSDNVFMGSSAGGVLLDLSNVNNFSGTTSGDIFSNNRLVFTDLKQAHTETLIPVGEDDYNNMKKYKNVNEYIKERTVDYNVMSKEESEKYFKQKEKEQGIHYLNIALKMEKDLKKAKEAESKFLGSLKQLTL